MTDRRLTRRQQQAAATQEQLLNAAREVFETRGYQATTVGAITKAAETAHGTFYLYFKNKEDAFGRVMEETADELYREAGARWGGDPYQAIVVATRGFLEVFVAHRGLWRALLEGTFQSEAVEAMWLDIRTRFVGRISRNLNRLQATGEIRDLDTEMAAHALGSMAEWFAFTHFVLGQPPPDEESFERAVVTLADLWYHAVYARVPDRTNGAAAR